MVGGWNRDGGFTEDLASAPNLKREGTMGRDRRNERVYLLCVFFLLHRAAPVDCGQ